MAKAVAAADGQRTSLREEFKKLTRERLIKAATELFASQGFRPTTIQQIAQRAGTTHTTFYQHFRNKADLVRLFRDEVNAEMDVMLAKLDASASPGWKEVRAWVDDYARMWANTHVRCEALWDAMGAEPELAADVITDGYRITGGLEKLLKSYPPADKERVQNKLVLLILMMDRLFFLLHSQERKLPSAKMQDDVADLIYLALQTPSVGSTPGKGRAPAKKAAVKKAK
ncbi:TetR/AcrR family transcriptional regulator [Solimonas soli]|jgi:AcrR family transcriptional regulator|uniref:TetR/AcrR family transcriptional regulator n=1 Tax=Solimonas soli TaxID=413479 RepID=UPI0004866BA8|nr:TetR/AcrR family transcriptional regulator [Solimonas soli]